MDLIYIWNENARNISTKTGFCLNSKYSIFFDHDEHKLIINENLTHISGFWGKNIINAIAIVGENGSGKTMLLNYIIESISYIKVKVNKPEYDFFILFKDEVRKKFICFITDKFSKPPLSSNQKDIEFYVIGSHKEILDEYKIGYFTSALSLSDYQDRKWGDVYDVSVGNLIRKNLSDKSAQKYVRFNQESELRTYFCVEDEKIIRFIYDTNEFNNKLNMDFPDLKFITIELYIYTKNQDLLLENFKDKKMEPGKKILLDFTKKISKDTNDCTWIKELLLNLILNIIRYLCVPTTSRDNRDNQWNKVTKVLEYLKENSSYTTIFDIATYFLKKLKKENLFEDLDPHLETYKNYMEFIKWIKIHKEEFVNARNTTYTCCFETTVKTKEFMNELLEYYKKTSFPFTYFNFIFNVSTGEFAFLNLYSNICQPDFLGNDWIDYNKNKVSCIAHKDILLILDEADLLLHPRWQQQYMQRLIKFISSKAFSNFSFHILVATHSPILLSDFPQKNVLYLQNQNLITKSTLTFGCNIYKLFIDSFFLEENGLIGEFAHKKISEIAEQLFETNQLTMNEKEIRTIIDFIGDEILQRQLLRLYKKKLSTTVEFPKKSLNAIQSSIDLLKKQRSELDNMIRGLENLKNDQDTFK